MQAGQFNLLQFISSLLTRYFFSLLLKMIKERDCLSLSWTCSLNLFQISGRLHRGNLLTRLSLALGISNSALFLRIKFPLFNSLLESHIFLNDLGTRLALYIYINFRLKNLIKDSTGTMFSLWNNGPVWALYLELVIALNAIFCLIMIEFKLDTLVQE